MRHCWTEGRISLCLGVNHCLRTAQPAAEGLKGQQDYRSGPHLSSPCCDTSDEKVLWFKRIIVTNKWKSKRVYGGLHEKCEFTQTWILCSFFEKTKLKKHDYLLVGLGWCELLQTGLIFSQLYHILPLGVAFCSSATDLWTLSETINETVAARQPNTATVTHCVSSFINNRWTQVGMGSLFLQIFHNKCQLKTWRVSAHSNAGGLLIWNGYLSHNNGANRGRSKRGFELQYCCRKHTLNNLH